MSTKGRSDDDFEQEIQAHLEIEAERLVAEGMTPDEARAAARRAFGGVLVARERFHETRRPWAWIWLEQFAQDVRYAWHGLLRSPAFLATTVITLAVALSLITVVFTIFNAYVLRPFAVRDPYSLQSLKWRAQDAGSTRFRWRDYEELRARKDLFDDVIAERGRAVVSDARRLPLSTAFVSGNYFEALGLSNRMRLGRGIAEFDAREPGGAAVAVLSDEGWERLFDRDPAVLGRKIALNDQSFVIIGVMRPEFGGLDDTPRELWVPLTMYGAVVGQELMGPAGTAGAANTEGATSATQIQTPEVRVIMRLRRDITVDHAQSALTPLMRRLVTESYPTLDARQREAVRVELEPQGTVAPLTLEMIAVLSPVFAAFGLVLVAACANVSSVMLARANARHREMGIRLSLGASRGRVVRQLLTEGLMISLIAGAAGMLLARITLQVGASVTLATLPGDTAIYTRIVPLVFDARVFLFTFAVAAVSTVVFALLPALQSTRLTLTDALRGHLGSGLRASTLRHVLVGGQVAVSVVLLIGTATVMRNARALASVDVGFDPRGVMSIDAGVSDPTLLARAAELLRSDPRIESVAAANRRPLSEQVKRVPVSPADAPAAAATLSIASGQTRVSPDYFSILRIPILRGRTFNVEEARSAAPVAIISAAGARALWPGENPIGKTVRINADNTDSATAGSAAAGQTTAVIVGVAGDVITGLVFEGREASHLYFPTSLEAAGQSDILLVRGRAGARELRGDDFRSVLKPLHTDPLAFEYLPLSEMMSMQMYPLNVTSWIGMILGGIALALSIAGLYGVLVYMLSQRTREIGIRMALGASASSVVRLVMTQSARLAGFGAIFGIVATFSVMTLLGAAVPLRGIAFVDAGAFAAGMAIVVAAAVLAAWAPARRASRIDPSITLRADS